VLEAARALVEEGGYPSATIEAIAARSGVAKTTIYRRWPHPTSLFVDLLVQLADAALPPPAGRDPLQALQAELRQGAAAAVALPGQLLVSLLWEAQHDPDVRAALLQRVLLPRREDRVRAIRRAQASGALRRDLPPKVAVDLLWGPLFYRMWVRHEPITPGFVTQVFEHALTGLRSGPRAARSAHGVARASGRRMKRRATSGSVAPIKRRERRADARSRPR
jgi:AcrR family transcriptional regulator